MPGTNRLLEALPEKIQRSLKRASEQVSLRRGEVLHEPGSTIYYLYFPLTCLVSITISMRDGKTAETGVVGNREMAGVNAFMGGSETTQTRYVVQIPGDALKIRSRPLREAFDRDKAVRDVFLHYTQAMIAQISQNAACNRLHDVTQRYARWLLEVSDRASSLDVHLTQNFVAEMLAVRRATVTATAGELEKRGLIEVSRSLIRIIDGKALEKVACECYGVISAENDRLLGPARA